MYFYPHWNMWKNQFRDSWNWKTLIEAICIKHASVINSEFIPGHNGLNNLGEKQNESIKINEQIYRDSLSQLLKDQPINSRNFLLAIHYAYAMASGDSLASKKVILYHIHVSYYIEQLLSDFPNAKILGMARDPRSNIKGRIRSFYNVDESKLNKTDVLIYHQLPSNYLTTYLCTQLHDLDKVMDLAKLVIVKHEDLLLRLDDVISNLRVWMGISDHECLKVMTFGGKSWWGDKVYGMPPTQGVYKRIVSQEWRKELSKLDWFVWEGVLYDCFDFYNYKRDFFNPKSETHHFLLLFLIYIPNQTEINHLIKVLNPMTHLKYLVFSWEEALKPDILKNYKWSGTYLFKWTYLPLKLWKTPLHRKILLNLTSRNRLSRQLYAPIYVILSYLRFLWSIVIFPWVVIKRATIMKKLIQNRRKKSIPNPNLI